MYNLKGQTCFLKKWWLTGDRGWRDKMNGVSGYRHKMSIEPQRSNVQYIEYRQYYCTISI